MTLSALASAAVCVAVGVSAQQPVPRTPWGDPDLQGVYTNSNESGIPMERPAAGHSERRPRGGT